MNERDNILRKVRILITNQFDSPEEALSFFDSKNEGRLRKSEIKKNIKTSSRNYLY